jgi:hypothetical protein
MQDLRDFMPADGHKARYTARQGMIVHSSLKRDLNKFQLRAAFKKASRLMVTLKQ